MTRAEHEEVRKELADILISLRAKLVGQHPQPAKTVERIRRLQACYDEWVAKFLPT